MKEAGEECHQQMRSSPSRLVGRNGKPPRRRGGALACAIGAARFSRQKGPECKPVLRANSQSAYNGKAAEGHFQPRETTF